ncbi:MAG: helix-turn-helix domain-containing protein [Firmicutes bacterium]|nr:helix-turn-helix domain-containing protein [Bacillota bacterium]
MEIFAKRLKELRLEKKLSLRKLATEFGLSHTTIEDYENNVCQPSMEMLLKISEYFGVTIGYLYGKEDY